VIFLMAVMAGFFIVASASNPAYATTAAVFFVGAVLTGRIDDAIDAARGKDNG
jgi:xanthine/uracil/vitamin C permease (AzgA family)